MHFRFHICSIIVQKACVCCECKNKLNCMEDTARGLTFSSDKVSLPHQTLATEPSSRIGLNTALQRLEQNTNTILTAPGCIPRMTLTPLQVPEKTQGCQKFFCFFQSIPEAKIPSPSPFLLFVIFHFPDTTELLLTLCPAPPLSL